MADWSKPVVTSNYITFVDEVKNRDIDAITLSAYPITNPPVNSVRLLRSPVKFQDWDGSQYVDRVLSIAGGGTGATSLSGLGGAMGLGSMAYQNSNSVSITGGGLNNVNFGGNINYTGGSFNFASTNANPVGITGPNLSNTFACFIQGGHVTGASGLGMGAGTSNADNALVIYNHDYSLTLFNVRGDGVVGCYQRLIIPVGPNKWAT